MGMEIEVNSLEELCDLMCYNIIPEGRRKQMTHNDINDLPTRDYIFVIGDRGKAIQARYDENTDALIFPRAAFDYVFKLIKERLESGGK